MQNWNLKDKITIKIGDRDIEGVVFKRYGCSSRDGKLENKDKAYVAIRKSDYDYMSCSEYKGERFCLVGNMVRDYPEPTMNSKAERVYAIRLTLNHPLVDLCSISPENEMLSELRSAIRDMKSLNKKINKK